MIKYILVDNVSSEMLSQDFVPTLSYEFQIISTIQEIDTREEFTLIVFDGIIGNSEAVMQLCLLSTMYKCSIIHVCSSVATSKSRLDDVAKVYAADYSKIVQTDIETACNITTSLYSGVAHVDSALEEPTTPLERKQSDIIKVLETNLTTMSDQIDKYSKDMRELTALTEVLISQKSEAESQLSELKEKCDLINLNVTQLNHINYSDIYTKMIMSKYNKAPTVVYIKEYMPLFNDYAFLEVLCQSIKMQLHKSVKVIKLMDNQSIKMHGAVPNKFKTLIRDYDVNDVLTNDLLVKFGKYSDVLDILLRNQMNISVLIIYDAKNYLDTILSGVYKGFNVCREYSQINNYRISPSNTITSTGEGGSLKWSVMDYARTTQDLMRCSSEEAILRILQAVEEE